MTPIAHPLMDVFLLGAITASSLVAGLFFLGFWRSTRDMLFFAFAFFFVIQAVTHAVIVTLPHPNEGSIWLFVVRLLAILVVLGAILWKNSVRP